MSYKKISEGYLTTGQVARQLKVCRHTALNFIKSGAIPSIRPGYDYLVKQADLDMYRGLSETEEENEKIKRLIKEIEKTIRSVR